MDYKQLRRVLRERLDAPGTETDETHMQTAEEAPAAVQELPVHDLPVNIAAMIGDEMVDPPVNDAEFLPGNLQQLQHAANVLVQNVPPLQVQDFYHKLRRLVTTSIRQQDRAGENQTDMLPEPSPDQELERADQEEANAEDQVDVTVAERIRRIAQTQVTEHRVRRAVKRVLNEQYGSALPDDLMFDLIGDFDTYKSDEGVRQLINLAKRLKKTKSAEIDRMTRSAWEEATSAGMALNDKLQVDSVRSAAGLDLLQDEEVATGEAQPPERRASGGEKAFETIAEDLFDEELKQNKEDLETLRQMLADTKDKKEERDIKAAIPKIENVISGMESERELAEKEGRRPRVNPESKNITSQILRKFDIEFKLAPFADRKIIDDPRVREKLTDIRFAGSATIVDVLDTILTIEAMNIMDAEELDANARRALSNDISAIINARSSASDDYRTAIIDVMNSVYDIPGVKIGKAQAADYRPGGKALGSREGGTGTFGKLLKGIVAKQIQDKIDAGELDPPAGFKSSAWPDFNKYDANPEFKSALIPIIIQSHKYFDDMGREHRTDARENLESYIQDGNYDAAAADLSTQIEEIGDAKLGKLVSDILKKAKESGPAADEN